MHGTVPTTRIIDQIKEESDRFQGLVFEVGKVVVGHSHILDFIVIAILCDGHVLLEGVPGVAKTTIIKTVTKALGLSFNRIQFTPDLLPADVIGTRIYNPKTQEFETKQGPIFANLILADEINRAPAKVQAALLEAMQEGQVTIGQHTYELPKPFLVFATQNPLEQEGTYRLPEAQVDRFMFKLLIDYPSESQECEILRRCFAKQLIEQALNFETIQSAQQLVAEIFVDEKIRNYIISLVFATRKPELYNVGTIKDYLVYGVSPRATIALMRAAQAHAFLKKRHFVTPDDVKAVSAAVLRHRLPLTYEAEADQIFPDKIVDIILNTVPTPL